MASTYIDYGTKQADLTKEIGRISAAQLAASSLAEGIASISLVNWGWGDAAFTANAIYQSAKEIEKSELQAQKEKLNAEESAQMTIYNSQIADIDSDAVVKTLHLQSATIAIESTEAALLLVQEVGRLAALYNEIADIERKMDEANSRLLTRYFADPVHRLRMQSDVVAAEEAFKTAQMWVFFMARALEYKWNTPFKNTFEGRTYSTNTSFGLRNAQELDQFVRAMAEFNGRGMLNRHASFDTTWFSVREDFLGFKQCPIVNYAESLCYTDPATGERLNSLTAFRRKLVSLKDSQGWIVLNFSTVHELPGGNFFVGPRFYPDGSIRSLGKWLDKIACIQINLPGGPHTQPTLEAQLTYGGTSFIRTESPGDNVTPDRRTGEMTAYTTRYWWWVFNQQSWQSKEAYKASVTMNLTTNPRINTTWIPVFMERSVAATGWKLEFPTKEGSVTVLDPNVLNDIEIFIKHRAFDRQ